MTTIKMHAAPATKPNKAADRYIGFILNNPNATAKEQRNAVKELTGIRSKVHQAERSTARKFESWVEAYPLGTLADLKETLQSLMDECERLSGYEPDWLYEDDNFGSISDATPEQWEAFLDDTGASGDMCEYLREFETIDVFEVVAQYIVDDMDDLKLLRKKYGAGYLVTDLKPEWPIIRRSDAY